MSDYQSLDRDLAPDPFDLNTLTRHRGGQGLYKNELRRLLYQAVRKGKPGIAEIAPKLLPWIASDRTLRIAWDRLAARGGTAPGPNGDRYNDFSSRAVNELLRHIGPMIATGQYRTGPEAKRKIPKDKDDPGRGYRTITKLNIQDRVVHRAVVEVLQPLLDPLFGENVLGFRPERGRLQALALAERLAVELDSYVLVAEDLKDAFDHVPIQPLLDVLAVYVPSPELVKFVGELLDTGHRCGIRQGSPLSPLMLNLYLHHWLDEPWRKAHPECPMIRVADDILALSGTKAEAMALWEDLRRLLAPAGMRLKGSPDTVVHDLRQDERAVWLGFTIRKGRDGFRVRLAGELWRALRGRLRVAHEAPDASFRAAAVIGGWVDQLGPCYRFARKRRVCQKIAESAAELGFHEVPSRSAILSRWRRRYREWEAHRSHSSGGGSDAHDAKSKLESTRVR